VAVRTRVSEMTTPKCPYCDTPGLRIDLSREVLFCDTCGKDWSLEAGSEVTKPHSTTRVVRQACGCEFTEDIVDFGHGDIHSNLYLTKCRCKEHYEAQFVAEWYDEEGHHKEFYTPTPTIPMEED